MFFKIERTCRQFCALRHYISKNDLVSEICKLGYFNNNIRKAKNFDSSELEKWVANSWNTEYILKENKAIVEGSGGFALQWAFPQAYYSAFGSTLAMFKAIGYTESSHTRVIKKFGELVAENKYPISVSFYCTGIHKDPDYYNISKPEKVDPFELDLENEDTVNNQICQFLKSTRKKLLEEKAPDLKFKTKDGKPKKSLSSPDWAKVSDRIGNTNLLSLLYRKRIKANYQNIDTFVNMGSKAEGLHTDLCEIVSRINLANELIIAKAIGVEEYGRLCDTIKKPSDHRVLQDRIHLIKNIL